MIFIYILLAILLFGALIAVHELGHFITAKLSGVRVNEFAIGMGPAVFKKKYGETLYALRVFPFGGFCAMEGEDGDSEDPRSFSKCHIASRFLIVIAGALMNLILGFLILSIIFAPIKEWYTPTVSGVNSSVEVTEKSLLPGDTIKSIDGYNIYLYNDIFTGLIRGGDDGKYDVVVVRDGEKVKLSGLSFKYGEAAEGSSEEKGIIEFVKAENSFLGKLKFTFQNGVNLVRLVLVGVSDLVTGKVSGGEVSGPVGIGKMMVDTAKTSMFSLWYLLAFISINLGIMNLLPLPALDGGRLFFIIIEAIFRKPVPPKYEGYVHVAGFVLLMLLMVLVTYNDIVKLIIK